MKTIFWTLHRFQFYSNSDVKEVNNKELNILAAPKCVSNAINSNNEGRRALSDIFSGLENQLFLAIGAKVMMNLMFGLKNILLMGRWV
jgi:hypothetical protein